MQFGKSIGTACSTFAITNIDDLFVLVTFFAEAATTKSITPLKITLGQYLGFTIIVIISMVGFGVSLALPSEPIGFLGLLPILLGVWKLLDDVIFPGEEEEEEKSKFASMKSILKVASITLMNGGDNIGTYVPLFSQAKGTEIAVYVVVYYILLGIWCFVAWLIMGQKHVLRLVERYMRWVIPFLYIGLGIYITVKSDAYPWSIEHIDNRFLGNPGKTIMSIVTTALLLTCIGAMLWYKLRQKTRRPTPDVEVPLEEIRKSPSNAEEGAVEGEHEGNNVDAILVVEDTFQGSEKKQEHNVKQEV
jgi:cadmium resistance transport/sequestration family protein